MWDLHRSDRFDPSEVFAASDPTPPPADPTPGGAPDPGPGDPGTPPATPGLSATDFFEVPNVGRVTRDELIKGYLRQRDYTQKTMGLSTQQREFETLRTQATAMEAALTQARALLSDRAKLKAYYDSLPGGEPELPADQVLTTAEVTNLLKRQIGESQQAFETRIAQAEERMATRFYQNQFENTIDGHLRSLGEKHPELKAVPGVEILIRQAVASQKPATIEDALSLFSTAAAFYADRLKGVAKTVVAPPNNPLTRGMEPPNGGGAPAPGTPGGDTFSGVKDPGLRSLVMADIERALARSAG